MIRMTGPRTQTVPGLVFALSQAEGASHDGPPTATLGSEASDLGRTHTQLLDNLSERVVLRAIAGKHSFYIILDTVIVIEDNANDLLFFVAVLLLGATTTFCWR